MLINLLPLETDQAWYSKQTLRENAASVCAQAGGIPANEFWEMSSRVSMIDIPASLQATGAYTRRDEQILARFWFAWHMQLKKKGYLKAILALTKMNSLIHSLIIGNIKLWGRNLLRDNPLKELNVELARRIALMDADEDLYFEIQFTCYDSGDIDSAHSVNLAAAGIV